jgi:hypothetical protein
MLVGVRCGEIFEATLSLDDKKEETEAEKLTSKFRKTLLKIDYTVLVSAHSSLYMS